MELPPPKLQNLTVWTGGTTTSLQADSNEVWEIGVPSKNSLPWCIVLSYLLSANIKEFSVFLRKLIGNDAEIEDIKKLSQSEIDDLRQRLNSFNPFKNRHTFFQQSKEVIEIFRIFDLRLKRYANSRKKSADEWNDDLKLNAAAYLLECIIEVHFPEEVENKKSTSYPKASHNFKSRIVLFQYENQQHGNRRESINVFHFAMTVEKAHGLKLDALDHILKKAKVSSTRIGKVKELMTNEENHGKSFLPTILRSTFSDILPKIYRSPYTALKLSEAAFETDPTATYSEKPSAFCCAVLYNTDLNYIRILYDYASNCRYYFDLSVRRANDTVLENLTRIKNVMKNDIAMLSRCTSEKHSKERASDLLKQFILFSEYQFNTASDLRDLEKKRTELTEFAFRKQVIQSILNHYSSFNKSRELSDLFTDYINLSEYYRNVDNYVYLCFFDNFFRLKLCIDLKRKSLFLNIEWRMFLALICNIYFSKFGHEMKYKLHHYGKDRCEKDYVLEYIPLMHRYIAVRNEINEFLGKLKNASDSKVLCHSLNIQQLLKNPHTIPEVIDELLITRLMMHMNAASEVSFGDDKVKAVLMIEKTLQVIGESIKPPSSNRSSVSYLLRSCLSNDLEKALVYIRNNISHYRSYSVYGRLTVEEDENFFDSIREQLREINTSFKIVAFTQFLRIEETVIFKFIEEFGSKLGEELRNALYEKYNLRVSEREKQYEDEEYHKQCKQLFWDVISKLRNNIKREERRDVLFGWLQTIKFLTRFILRHKYEEKLENFLKDIRNFIAECQNKELDDFKNDISSFLLKYIDVPLKRSSEENANVCFSAIEKFSRRLKREMFTDYEIDCIEKVMQNAYEDAEDARNKLEDMFTSNSYVSSDKLAEYLDKVLIPKDKVNNLRMAFDSRKSEKALKKYLRKTYISKKSVEGDVKKLFRKFDIEEQISDKDLNVSVYTKTLLTKITYQKYLNRKIYASVELPEEILVKLEKFLTKKVQLLITRLKALKSILIDEDEDIKETWAWGRSDAIKHHMQFLIHQRYMREITFRASLEMAFLDCINILNKSYLIELYEKSTGLFAGVNLRNVISHCTNIETFSSMLDKDDFPLAMIEKMLELINDTEAIETMLKLFTVFGDIKEESFKDWIENSKGQKYSKEINAVKSCERWDKYLFLFPFSKI